MKADPEVKMISAEAPILFAKGCDIFITELTMRAWIHAEENKRRTLQRSDIASALTKSDMFDFLIDIVPREEATSHKRNAGTSSAAQAQANVAQEALPGQAVQQQGMHPPPQHMQQTHYGMPQHIQEQDYRQQGIYGQPVAADMSAYGQPQGQPFDQAMYSAYGIPPQQVSVTVRGPAPALIASQMYQVSQQESGRAGNLTHGFRRHQDSGDDADAEGERAEYGPS